MYSTLLFGQLHAAFRRFGWRSFHSGASAVWGEDRLAAGKLFNEENFSFLDNFDNNLPHDFISYDSGVDYLQTLHDPLFGSNTLKDYNLEMYTPNRTRKCSISDIIEVLNEDNLFLQNPNTKDDGYDSGHPESTSSPRSDDSVSSGDLSFDKSKYKSTGLDINELGDHGISNTTQYIAMKNISQIPSHSNQTHDFEANDPLREESLRTPLQVTLNSASTFLQSEDDAVIVVMDKSKGVQYVSTSREKLEYFLKHESHNNLNDAKKSMIEVDEIEASEIDSTLPDGQNCDAKGKKKSTKRGRKRIYDCSNEEQTEDSKRVRNNKACQKFRKVKTERMKNLFEAESELLQQNLNLKEEVAALQRQMAYMRKKLGEEDKTNV